MADALNMPIAWPYQRVIHMFISFFKFDETNQIF